MFERIFAVYNRHLLNRRFSSLHVKGLDFLLNKNVNLPLIIYCNHSSWWDGLVAFQISDSAGLDSFIMMEEKHLKRLFLFRLLGAFSVLREKPREAYKSIEYAARLLIKAPDRTLWIFPQGEILPNDLRPLTFYKGLSKIIKKVENCYIASLSLRYEFLGNFKPQIFVNIEKPERISFREGFNSTDLNEMLVDRLTKNLDELKNDVIFQKLAHYKSIT